MVPPKKTDVIPLAQRRAVKEKAKALFKDVAGVSGFGISAGVRIYVHDEDVLAQLPKDIDGVPVEGVVVGYIRAL